MRNKRLSEPGHLFLPYKRQNHRVNLMVVIVRIFLVNFEWLVWFCWFFWPSRSWKTLFCHLFWCNELKYREGEGVILSCGWLKAKCVSLWQLSWMWKGRRAWPYTFICILFVLFFLLLFFYFLCICIFVVNMLLSVNLCFCWTEEDVVARWWRGGRVVPGPFISAGTSRLYIAHIVKYSFSFSFFLFHFHLVLLSLLPPPGYKLPTL